MRHTHRRALQTRIAWIRSGKKPANRRTHPPIILDLRQGLDEDEANSQRSMNNSEKSTCGVDLWYWQGSVTVHLYRSYSAIERTAENILLFQQRRQRPDLLSQTSCKGLPQGVQVLHKGRNDLLSYVRSRRRVAKPVAA